MVALALCPGRSRARDPSELRSWVGPGAVTTFEPSIMLVEIDILNASHHTGYSSINT